MLQKTGWHGTTNSIVTSILKKGFSYNKYAPGKTAQRHPNDLGNGIYFYLPFLEDDGDNIATAYVKKYKSKFISSENPVVLMKATLSFEDGTRIFLLDDLQNRQLLSEFREKTKKVIQNLLEDIQDNGAKKRASRVNQNQGLIIELLLDLHAQKQPSKTYQAVQGKTFTDVSYKSMNTHDGVNGCEICVRDLQCIVQTEVKQ